MRHGRIHTSRPSKLGWHWIWRLSAVALLIVSSSVQPCGVASAQVPAVPLADLELVLLDDGKSPIAGVEVVVISVQVQEPPRQIIVGGRLTGPIKQFVSDPAGKVILTYPLQVPFPPDQIFPTRSIKLRLSHSDFVTQEFDLDVRSPTNQVALQMERGCTLNFSAVNEAGQQEPDFAVFLSDKLAPGLWKRQGVGRQAVCAPIPGDWQALLVKPQADGPTLFSEVLTIRFPRQRDLRLHNVSLKPGLRLNGRLSENVTRPVKNGYVLLTSNQKRTLKSNSASPLTVWHDWCEVQPDGTFGFPSLPLGGELEIIGICDGWMSTGRKNESVTGQVFATDETSNLELTLEMEPTGTLDLTVLDVDGTPLSEGDIYYAPFQINSSGTSGGSLGLRTRTLDRAILQLKNITERSFARANNSNQILFTGQLNAEGRVLLRNVPLNIDVPISLRHPKLMLLSEQNRSVQFKLLNLEPMSLTLKTTPIIIPGEWTQQRDREPDRDVQPGRLGVVQGQITLDGQPLTGAILLFGAGVVGASSDLLGHYKFSRPIPSGTYRVQIATRTAEGAEKVPAKYNTMSKLEIKVVPGANTFDFDLSSKEP